MKKIESLEERIKEYFNTPEIKKKFEENSVKEISPGVWKINTTKCMMITNKYGKEMFDRAIKEEIIKSFKKTL